MYLLRRDIEVRSLSLRRPFELFLCWRGVFATPLYHTAVVETVTNSLQNPIETQTVRHGIIPQAYLANPIAPSIANLNSKTKITAVRIVDFGRCAKWPRASLSYLDYLASRIQCLVCFIEPRLDRMTPPLFIV